MKSFQDQKSLILSYYDELEAASAGSVKKVISQFAALTLNGMVSIRLMSKMAEMR